MLLATASPHSTMRTLRKMSIDQVAFVDPGIGGAHRRDDDQRALPEHLVCVGLPTIERGAAYRRYHGTITAVPWWQYTEVRACSTIAVVTPSGHGAPGDRQITIAAWCITTLPGCTYQYIIPTQALIIEHIAELKPMR